MKTVNFLIWAVVVFLTVSSISVKQKSVQIVQKQVLEQVGEPLFEVQLRSKIISEEKFQDLLSKNQKLRNQFYKTLRKKQQ